MRERSRSDGSPERGVKDFWEPHWRFFETFDEYFEHPAQVRTPGGSPGHGRWNISGLGLPDDVSIVNAVSMELRYAGLDGNTRYAS